ncbi:hypothetical protein CC80DRAFT_497783 [Byssothecium circinans]|uniref:Actin-like ATPase domain-containing protein n=1 Tax=Byssothecium circinans TaxID=147558 RepID=A0A6A5T816_9PLEO|nr:hypothetical protein CC80DRAFT_497783 [Byssothecium circinans]
MAPQTRNAHSRMGLIDPGSIFDDLSDDGDVEMTQDEPEEGDKHKAPDGNEEADEDMIFEETATGFYETDRLIIAVDFGTTFSSVAYVRLKRDQPTTAITLSDIQCIGEYPGYSPPPGIPSNRWDVPTELWYDPVGGGARQDHISGGTTAPQDSDGSSEHDSGGEDSLSNDDDSEYEDGVIETTELEGQVRQPVRPGKQYWGFEVQEQLRMRDIPKKEARPLSRFKLMLDEKWETKEVRDGLKSTLQALKKRKFVKQETDIYTHYLTHLLRHAKQQLELSGILQRDVTVEFVLCVPAKWPSKGCRIMQAAMKEAVNEAGLGDQASDSVANLFMISEPEAAAACVLDGVENEIYNGETVVILDAGGGTVDAVTYQCTYDNPLRLSAEVVPPDSKLCGASYINERFESLLVKKLREETYLVKNGKTIRSIAEAKTAEFENSQKRKIDTTRRGTTLAPIYIDDLQADPSRNFYQNRLTLTHQEIHGSVFHKSLAGARSVLDDQLQLAKSYQNEVQKVILTGGFGQSRALQSYLKSYLRKEKSYNLAGTRIDLIIPDNPSTAVAQGAVLRALDKANGPSRITQCSYGYLSSEPYEPEVFEEHRQTKCRVNKADGEKYVDDTINWFIQAGESVPNEHEVVIEVKHTFPLTAKKLLCKEELYVSDERHRSHYRKTHPSNKGAERAGSIVADMTFLKAEGLIEPESPSEFSTYSSTEKRHWAVKFELVMVVEGRSLSFKARWPLKSDLKAGQRQEVHAQGQVCIAAAFQPGTA